MTLTIDNKDSILELAKKNIETSDVPVWHVKRYLESLNWLHPYLIGTCSPCVLETGGITPFSNALELYSDLTLEHTLSDLRYEIDKPGNRYDVVISMEVLEHLNDVSSDNIGSISTWLYSGMNNYLSEVKRVLKPGGVLFLTTPNVCSTTPILNILNNVAPFSFPKHIRELSPTELRDLIEAAGLSLIDYQSLTMYQHTIRSQKALEERGWKVPSMGDTQFVLATST